jgi:Nucleotidyltransferase of unknown function (DUF6036)
MFQQLLEQIALGLEKLGIPYMVIGGQATLLYGEPRLTRDIDVTLGVGLERWTEISQLAEHSAWRLLADRNFSERTLVLPCVDGASGIRIDFVFSHSPYERQAVEQARQVPMGQAKVRFATPEDLIVHKIVAGRPRDLEDVRGILLREHGLDVSYIDHWLKKFDASLQESFVERFEAIRKSAAPT